MVFGLAAMMHQQLASHYALDADADTAKLLVYHYHVLPGVLQFLARVCI
jgi:hypothetical protein